MSATDYLLSVIDKTNPRKGVAASMARGFLAGCAGLYDAGLEAYLAGEKVGARRRGRLPCPVISVGNLTVGGTGKTPMTAMLCRRLRERGLRVTILSRGHGGSSNAARVVSTPEGAIVLSPADAGDEPVLLARLCPGIPVVVGKDRRLSGREALRNWPVDVFVLDDGFQFWQLARDVDIVLLDSTAPFDNGYPLPRGLLREPARHLRRGHLAVVTRADRLDDTGRHAIVDKIHNYASEMPIFFASHAPAGFVAVDDALRPPSPQSWGDMTEATIVALSAIAQPESFYRTLGSLGCHIAREMAFVDHHKFDQADVDAAMAAVEKTGATALVMTEKDAVKWPAGAWKSKTPVLALRIAMQFEDEDGFIDEVLRRAGIET